jgi:hypothetical protein
MHYARTRIEPHGILPFSAPVSVRRQADSVIKLSSGPPLASPSDDTSSFWVHLKSMGGDWMWDHVELPFALDAVVEAISSG